MASGSVAQVRSFVVSIKSCLILSLIVLFYAQTIFVSVSGAPAGIVDSNELFELPFKLPSGFNFGEAPSPFGCGFVFRNADHFSREIAAQRIDRDHKIIKYIENCYKSADGWRFKKSTVPRPNSDEKMKRKSQNYQQDSALKEALKQFYNDLRTEAAFSAILSKLSANQDQEIGDKL